jgi:hypothetical protein
MLELGMWTQKYGKLAEKMAMLHIWLKKNLKDCVVFGTSGPSDPVIAPPFEVLGLIMLGRSLVR